jgi:tRNA(Ile)-lysidine synthase
VFERLSNKVQMATFSVADTEILLPIPGRIGVKGTPWVASAEIVAGERLQEVRQALLREDWPEVWRLLPSTRHIVYIDGDRVGSFLRVRTRRPGDRIRPLGMAQEKKVQDVLVDAHIPRAERASIPLFFSASHCVWLAGVHIDDRVRLTSGTQRILRLSIEPGS